MEKALLFRLMFQCYTFIDELGEDAMYEQFREGNDIIDFLCNIFTKDCHGEKAKKDEKKKEL